MISEMESGYINIHYVQAEKQYGLFYSTNGNVLGYAKLFAPKKDYITLFGDNLN